MMWLLHYNCKPRSSYSMQNFDILCLIYLFKYNNSDLPAIHPGQNPNNKVIRMTALIGLFRGFKIFEE